MTGGGRGVGRSHSLALAAAGAAVVVNDAGFTSDGSRKDEVAVADEVVEEIVGAGGLAVATRHDITDWSAGAELIQTAVDSFGGLDILVNNAGFLSDSSLIRLSEQAWDRIIGVHLKGTLVPARHAASYWRERSKAGASVAACILNTTSTSGLMGNIGQSNYGAAKGGVAALTLVWAQELYRYGVRTNAIIPSARTRLTEATPGLDVMVQPPEDDRFDPWDPGNVAPLSEWLATAGCPANGRVFLVQGGAVTLMEGWKYGEGVEREGRWTTDELAQQLTPLVTRK